MAGATENAGYIGALAGTGENATLVAGQAADGAAGEAPKIVDFDAGEGWPSETIPLAHPFKYRGVVYSGLTMRTPSGLDVTRFYSAGERPSIVAFAIGLMQIDDAVFGAMHAADAAKLVTRASSFLADAR